MASNHETLSINARPPTAWRERVGFTLLALVMVALGAGFWLANGTRTFGELMLGAFSWCF